MKFLFSIVLSLFLIWQLPGFAQSEKPASLKTYVLSSDTLLFDSLSIVPGTLKLYNSRFESIDTACYTLDPVSANIVFSKNCRPDTIMLSYRTFPIRFDEKTYLYDRRLIQTETPTAFDPFVLNKSGGEESYGFSELNKSGSISRGIAFGNSQDLSVNSTLNLQLSGKISPEISVLASISDDNLPIQPQGNTQQLQDFDRVFIQLYDDKSKLTAGDFQLKSRDAYFIKYFKRAQGASFETKIPFGESKNLFIETSAAVSKGKFARNIIQGIEGSQGPYRLRGADNERFIVVLAGTERVYIDGRQLQRGQEFDYIIDYNTAEIIFTPRQLITKDRRITVEFQYSDKNYARSLLQGHLSWQSDKTHSWLSVYSEQDSKNQPLQQDLDEQNRLVLINAGDNSSLAVVSGVEPVEFSNDRVLYEVRDSLGYDSIFVWTTNASDIVYRVSFSPVGAGMGDYIEDQFTANGKVYKWVAPELVGDQLIRKGEYAPVISLVAPQKRQTFGAGNKIRLKKQWEWQSETALSIFDKNTFSAIDSRDDAGFAAKTGIGRYKPLPDSVKWTFIGGLDVEFAHKNFNPIERFRAVEFERNWNLSARTLSKSLLISQAKLGLGHIKKGSFLAGAEMLNAGDEFSGIKSLLFSDLRPGTWFFGLDASYLQIDAGNKSSFLRHRGHTYKNFKSLRIGYKDEHERNQISEQNDSLSAASYQFYEWQSYAQYGDSSKTGIKLFYGGRTDKRANNNVFNTAAIASQYGGSIHWLGSSQQSGALTLSSRNLSIANDSLISQSPENTLLARLEQRFRLGKGWISGDLFYEIGSGLEQRREFIYLEVPAGQGVYIWIDYNNDGIKDLNEFEVAQFSYEANYIRTFTPSDEYARTYTNDLSSSVQFKPASLPWFKSGKNAAWIGLFSDQLAYKVSRKTLREDNADRFNPFITSLQDTVLMSQNAMWRNILFFNRTNTTFGADYTFQQSRNKNLLANGFETRGQRYNQFRIRWSPDRKYTLELSAEEGEEGSSSDFISNRNFNISYQKAGPSFTWQPDLQVRITADAKYADKKNDVDLGGEKAEISEAGLELRYNQPSKSSFQADFRLIRILYSESNFNNSLGFEMLEGLRPGQNFTWSANWQRSLPGNLQISLIYNGRKSENQNTIHSGGVQARAFF